MGNSENSNVSSLIKSSTYKVDGQSREYKEYLLNRDGITLYLFNIEGYVDFKMAYINRFNEMEKELEHTRAMRAQGIDVRCNLTDAIKEHLATDANKQFIYAQYTNLIYRKLFNSTARQLRESLNVKTNGALRNVLRSEVLEEIASLENKVAVLVEFGMEYDVIKSKLGV